MTWCVEGTPTLYRVGYPIRKEHAGCWSHVGTRGNNRRPIFTNDASRRLFLVRLLIVVARYGWTFAAYCLMGNHYHLVIRLGNQGMWRDEGDLVATCRYVELNPYRAGPNVLPAAWPWSSHRATIGLAVPAKFHSPEVIWSMFGQEPRDAMRAWQAYVDTGLNETRPVSDIG
jgi:putative transposase